MGMTGAFGMVETHLRGKRILLVDDERELADMVATILHGAGFASVDIANSSVEALSSIAARRPPRARLPAVRARRDDARHGRLRAARTHPQRPAHTRRPLCSSRPKTSLSIAWRADVGRRRLHRQALSAQELVLRIAAVLAAAMPSRTRLELAASRVNFATAEVERADGQTVPLTAKEHEILSVLARNAGRIVTIDLCARRAGARRSATRTRSWRTSVACARRSRPTLPRRFRSSRRADWATSWSSAALEARTLDGPRPSPSRPGDRRTHGSAGAASASASRASSRSSCCCSQRARSSSSWWTSFCTPPSPTGNRTRTSTTARRRLTTRRRSSSGARRRRNLRLDAGGAAELAAHGAWSMLVSADGTVVAGRRAFPATCHRSRRQRRGDGSALCRRRRLSGVFLGS